MVARDRVQQLGEHGGVEVAAALLDHPQAEVDVSEQAPLVRLPERRARPELADPADVVQERGGEDDVVAEARMELRGLAAERGDADRVLEEAARVAVVTVGRGGGERPERLADLGVATNESTTAARPFVRDLGGEELEEAVELVRIAPHGRGERGRVGVLGGLDRAHLHLQLPPKRSTRPSTRTASPSPKRWSSRSTSFQTRASTRPLASASSSARYGSACAGASPLLSGDCEHAFDGPVLDELGDRGHVSSLWAKAVGTLAAMADIQPFRAVRYAGAAGSLADLVAPPYDAVDDEERARSTRAARTTSST